MNRPKGLSIFITMAGTYYSVFQPMGWAVGYKGVYDKALCVGERHWTK